MLPNFRCVGVGVNREEIKRKVIEALKEVYDPEIPVDVYNLGLVYDINVDDEGNVKVVLGATAPGCPVAYMIVAQAEEAIRRKVPEAKNVQVELDLYRPWDPRRITKEGREKLKALYGYDIVEEMIKRMGLDSDNQQGA
ncbi:metal-sulfur cluster assembly factor [Pyrolobus fumarii]|uniref:metal-sulfur cluster assembly factor n=1 Tax=Pyrolobus fumarii TaxID=54252 RepID=UPI00064EC6F4